LLLLCKLAKTGLGLPHAARDFVKTRLEIIDLGEK
jgi:hypothetical protein